jgi:nitroimidazol reductase NimA-like FMN-containing flavoprotein (pyridoxamine 5'-phosphate oxidase superfamily)
VIPVWQEWDGDHFHVIAWQGSQWSEYLLQNPSVSLTVDEPWPPLRRVVVRGQAQSLEPDQGGLDTASLLDRMSRRYLGQAYSGQAGQVQRSFRISPNTCAAGRACQEAHSDAGSRFMHWSILFPENHPVML